VAPGVPIPVVGAWPVRPRPHRLRIGYLSSDLRSHAVGFLTGEVFGLHDRARVQVHAYYCGPDLHDQTRERIAGSVDSWTTISALDDRQAAARMIDDEIDILVDLNGYTKDARPKLIALRPAPIIVNWLGFPGSAGSPHHHYIIADGYVIPPGDDCFYSERVLRLPCYQPNDRQRIVAAQRPTRAEAGLPDDATVFCCFNGSQKLTRATFRRLMSILRDVPESVLWMLAGNDDTNGRLQAAAEALGVPRDRLVFAPRRSNPDHLARYPLADLFLDTYPYGAHTTASDALWMGVPILTLSGRAFASRVCGSLATAAGLPELVCEDAGQFISLAIELGRDRARLMALRQRLEASRTDCTLFDTPRLVAHLEALYEQMWREYADGRLPVADLTNLETYAEIGCELDHEADEDRLERPPNGYYEHALRFRHAISPLPADGRLWKAGLSQKAAAD
jgi:predicted O-linked N-acetylglucosamine transferase (SPINDLY family)